MPIFTPAYRPTKHQQSFLVRQQKVESKKRKRATESSEGDDVDDRLPSNSPQEPTKTTSHPVRKTDPFFIAGHSREEPLPPPPFPHAAAPGPSKEGIAIEEELAGLNPPLYVPAATSPEDKPTSLKRRHLDNLTTILHRSMLNGDWDRASRAWSLLIRTEVAGRGVDIRRNGRWGIGAEILMRRGVQASKLAEDETLNNRDDTNETDGSRQGTSLSRFSEEGFRLAREYYERMILQYAHTPYTQHGLNAAAIYPALFSVWIYEIQDRSKQARQRVTPSGPQSLPSSRDSTHMDDTDSQEKLQIQQIRSEELEQALPIAARMDELLLGPPYDANATLLQLRGMVALWISDLHTGLAGSPNDSVIESEISSLSDVDVRTDAERHLSNSVANRRRAKELFERLKASGVKLPQEIAAFTEDSD